MAGRNTKSEDPKSDSKEPSVSKKEKNDKDAKLTAVVREPEEVAPLTHAIPNSSLNR